MSLFCIALLVAFLGAVGGLVNCFDSGEFHLPFIDKKNKIWRPGWIGIVVTGAAAAIIVWGVYGPAASFIINGDGKQIIQITISQIFSSLLVGFGGGRFLRMAVEKKADQFAKNKLAEAVQKALEQEQ